MKSIKKKAVIGTMLVLGVLIVASLLPIATVSYDDIREAAIRHHLRNTTAQDTYFIQIDGADPGQEFLARFQDVPWKVKPASRARFREPGHAVFDPEDGADSMILEVGDIAWGSPWHVTISYGYYVANRGAAYYRYWMVWKFGRWVVVAEDLGLVV